MYNGQPPFPGNGLPPFPPQMPPNGAMPASFPPFAPPFPPPFPGMRPPSGPGVPSPATPGMMPSPVPMSGMQTPGMPFRPPPMGYTPRPAHPGLGLTPHGLPQPPHMSTSTPKPDVKTTKVFVGGIAPGITDETLEGLLNACGPLHELKRVIGASGKPQAFGFAMFENPEVVLRCIRCLNGVELPDMTPEGRRDRKPAKKLIVKADEKTQAFLEEFESTLGRSDSDEEADASTRKSIQHIIALLTDPNAQHPDGPSASNNGGQSPVQVVVPAHLQDLQEGDLPEEQRVAVLGQIAVFRENAAKREREKKLMEEEKERYKAMQSQGGGQRQAPSGYGYGNRGLAKQQQQAERQWGSQSASPAPAKGAGPSRYGPGERDPQAYDKPVSFVKAETMEGKAESGRTDEEEEELRRRKIQMDKDIALRDAERRVEARERTRLDALSREMNYRQTQKDLIARSRARQEDLYARYDDDDYIERSERERDRRDRPDRERDVRELFYVDRPQWRARRQKFRQNEYQADLRDRQHEEDERQALERESEEFLKKQMAELAALEQSQRAQGLLTEDAAPIKLAINPSTHPPPPPKEEKKHVVAPRPGVQFEGEDDDEESGRKKKGTFVRLDEEEEGDGLSEAEKRARRNARLLEVKKGVPNDRRSIWKFPVEWAAVGETLVQSKIKPFVQEKIKNFLGELDEDLADFVLEHLRDRKGADDLVDGLEPILAEDAESFVLQLWRQLVFESLAFKEGMDTGSMMI
ncbi:hypothetical protein I312_102326 [Cryptococcus bacillisporus CA1280]|uniref:Unplaced genomic scaffold supercont1.4, whole genome shotgun sequence n=1 Tax=Cryptococcus bacillisporus CA1280 TaxID=1296109 RepID=A0A0D0VTE2_CRYGA|nr:hypothetical protein I312_01719 [Cryptococcus bacillisporus CA1280]